MRIKVYALDAASGASRWSGPNGADYIELEAGAALRHVSTANGLVFVTASSGQLFVLSEADGHLLFTDQTADLNQLFSLGLGKPHHASMNGGVIISSGQVYVPYGAQNNPSGGLLVYEINNAPVAQDDRAFVPKGGVVTIPALRNDRDPDGDALRFVTVAGNAINTSDHIPDTLSLPEGLLEVVNPGDDPNDPTLAYVKFTPKSGFVGHVRLPYVIEDVAPTPIVNGAPQIGAVNTTHRARTDAAIIHLRVH
jgi:hypothetical protein